MSAEAVVADILRFWDRPLFHNFLEKLAPGLRGRLIDAMVPTAMTTDRGCRAALWLLESRLARSQQIPSGGDLLVYAPTRNNGRAIAPLVQMIGELGLVPCGGGRRSRQRHRAEALVPSRSELARLLPYGREQAGFVSLQLLHGLAAYSHFLRVLSDHPCRAVLLANDHSPVPLALRHAANALGRRTIYRQHAPVSVNYPSLDCDLAVLANQVSASIYGTISDSMGIPTASRPPVVILPLTTEPPQQIRKPNKLKRWLVLMSRVWDPQGLAACLSIILSRHETTEVCLRLHPADRRDPLSVMALRDPRLRVLPVDQPMMVAAGAADIALASGTGAALETLHFGVPTFYCRGMDNLAPDPHGLVAEGVLPEVLREALHTLDLSDMAVFGQEWQARLAAHDPTAQVAPETLWAEVHAALGHVLGLDKVKRSMPAAQRSSIRNPRAEDRIARQLVASVWMGFNLPQENGAKEREN